jgi:DivIVA domain-containing protein
VLHLLWYGLLAILLAAGLFALAARFLPAGEQIAPPLRDEPPWELPPDGSLRADDVDSVRLPVALRGYRFAETDLLLDRLAGELRTRDAEILRLRGGIADGDSASADGSAAGAGSDDPVLFDVEPQADETEPEAASEDTAGGTELRDDSGARPAGDATPPSSWAPPSTPWAVPPPPWAVGPMPPQTPFASPSEPTAPRGRDDRS